MYIAEAIILPTIVNGHLNNGDVEITTEDIFDYNVRTIILRKKGVFYESGDIHRFYVKLEENVEYIARMKITAIYGGFFSITIRGVFTHTTTSENIISSVTKYALEAIYTSDTTGNRYVELIYNFSASPERTEYTLYFNKTGFAGWWWIILSGIGALAILAFIFTFMVIGLISVAKRKKKGKKRRIKKKK
jgi:hypothetical protein